MKPKTYSFVYFYMRNLLKQRVIGHNQFDDFVNKYREYRRDSRLKQKATQSITPAEKVDETTWPLSPWVQSLDALPLM